VERAHAFDSRFGKLSSRDEKIEWLLVKKVQGVRLEFMLDPVAKAGWPDEMQRHCPMQADAQ
jgi:hypothetical protein